LAIDFVRFWCAVTRQPRIVDFSAVSPICNARCGLDRSELPDWRTTSDTRRPQCLTAIPVAAAQVDGCDGIDTGGVRGYRLAPTTRSYSLLPECSPRLVRMRVSRKEFGRFALAEIGKMRRRRLAKFDLIDFCGSTRTSTTRNLSFGTS
jgi:hypothetical protein